jgi:hypothetical protein
MSSRRFEREWIAFAFCLAIGCGDAPRDSSDADAAVGRPYRDRTTLIDLGAFTLTDAESDPFPDRPPEPIPCSGDGTIVEVFGGTLVYSVYSDKCSYVTAVQPSRTDVYEGEYLRARLWHFDLTAPAPAEAHLAVTLDGATDGLEKRIPIPAAGQMISETWRAPRDYPRGTPVYFHAHNHGDNEYLLIELSTGTEDPAVLEADGGCSLPP